MFSGLVLRIPNFYWEKSAQPHQLYNESNDSLKVATPPPPRKNNNNNNETQWLLIAQVTRVDTFGNFYGICMTPGWNCTCGGRVSLFSRPSVGPACSLSALPSNLLFNILFTIARPSRLLPPPASVSLSALA